MEELDKDDSDDDDFMQTLNKKLQIRQKEIAKEVPVTFLEKPIEIKTEKIEEPISEILTEVIPQIQEEPKIEVKPII